LCDLVWGDCAGAAVSDSALMARELYRMARSNLLAAASRSRNGRRLLGVPELRDDVPFCLQRDAFDFAAALREDGTLEVVR